MTQTEIMPRWRVRALHFYSIASIIEGLATFVYLVSIPGDPANAWLLGFSKSRLALLLAIVLGIVIFSFFEIKLWRDPSWVAQFLSRVQKIFLRNGIYYGVIVILFVCGIITSHFIWLSSVLTDAFIQGLLARLLPIILWGGILSWQTILLLPILRYDEPIRRSSIQSKFFRISLFVFIFLLGLWIFVAVSGIGITPDVIGWDTPGAPVLPLQVWAAVLLGLGFFVIESSLTRDNLERSSLIHWLDIVISVLIFFAAIFIWMREPMERAYYAPMERAPNYELYPFSDAAMYDSSAQRLLLGEGFTGISRKPLYVLLLVLAHSIAGNDYFSVANIQVIILAVMPVIAYWLTKSMHTRISGIIMPVLLIFREKNAIALSADIRIVNSKILMSDLPVGLVILLFTWLLIRWLQNPAQNRWHPLLVGGVFGLSMLIRSNSVIMLAFILFLFVIIFTRRPLNGIFSVALFFLGLGLTIAPWMWRSYQMTGRASFNDPRQVAQHAEFYTHDPGTLKLPQLPDESDKAYLDRLNAHVMDFTLENPGVVAGFVVPHVFHNQISMILALPMTPWLVQHPNTVAFNYELGDRERLWDECCSANNYVGMMPFWDMKYRGAVSPEMMVVLALNLLLIAVGLGSAWMRYDIVGWIPLGISLAYSLSTSIARFSGWRFAIPVDWVVYLYYAIGLGQVFLWLIAFLSRNKIDVKVFKESQNTWQRVDQMEFMLSDWNRPLMVSLFLFVIGISPLLVEKSISPYFGSLSKNEGVALLEEAGLYDQLGSISETELTEYVNNEQTVVLQGRVFYPRFYLAGEGESGSGWYAYAPKDYSRLGFSLIGSSENPVIIARENPPTYFPNASDVVIIGCEREHYIDALAVLFKDNQNHLVVRSPLSEVVCPPSFP
ncbi:MAG: hypothetical protein ISR58_03350 [Anaerolineales bacterium]|nr:hypothetical protein [Chloroflexota bacterium]MBL6980208.1 hypothetical protein [Anaerolineales bacterium]